MFLAGSKLWSGSGCVDQLRRAAGELRELPDASEPFERIRDAIKEAHSQIAGGPHAREDSQDAA